MCEASTKRKRRANRDATAVEGYCSDVALVTEDLRR